MNLWPGDIVVAYPSAQVSLWDNIDITDHVQGLARLSGDSGLRLCNIAIIIAVPGLRGSGDYLSSAMMLWVPSLNHVFWTWDRHLLHVDDPCARLNT